MTKRRRPATPKVALACNITLANNAKLDAMCEFYDVTKTSMVNTVIELAYNAFQERMEGPDERTKSKETSDQRASKSLEDEFSDFDDFD